MNWVDLVIIIILLAFVWRGWGKPFFSELFDLSGFILSFLLSLRFYNLAGDFLQQNFSLPRSFANILGFIVVWYGVEVSLFIITRLFYRSIIQKSHFPKSKFMGTIPAFFKGVIFVSIILMLITTFPMGPKLKQAVGSSQIGSLVLTNTYQLEAPLKTVFGGLANDTLSFLTVEPKTNESRDLGFKNHSFVFDDNAESEMLRLLNEERVKEGFSPLALDTRLVQVARNHSADMFVRGYFAHTSPEGLNAANRMQNAGILYLVVGENLAYAPSVGFAHRGLMNSPGHRANILSPDYHFIGVGVADGGQYGMMFTQVFKN